MKREGDGGDVGRRRGVAIAGAAELEAREAAVRLDDLEDDHAAADGRAQHCRRRGKMGGRMWESARDNATEEERGREKRGRVREVFQNKSCLRTIVRDSIGVERRRHGRKVQLQVVQERVLRRQKRRAVEDAVVSGGGRVEGDDDVRLGADGDEASGARLLKQPVVGDGLRECVGAHRGEGVPRLMRCHNACSERYTTFINAFQDPPPLPPLFFLDTSNLKMQHGR